MKCKNKKQIGHKSENGPAKCIRVVNHTFVKKKTKKKPAVLSITSPLNATKICHTACSISSKVPFTMCTFAWIYQKFISH